jgi:hypothetical protein
MVAWWAGLAPVDQPGDESMEDHHLEWRDGEFRLARHPDPEAERALAALGGDRCPCLDIYDAWHEQHRHPSILAVGARHPDASVEMPARAAARARDEVKRFRTKVGDLRADARRRGDMAAVERLDALAVPAGRAGAQRLGFLQLLARPSRLQHRLQASVAATLADQGRHDELIVATAARALPALRDLGWRGGLTAIELVADPDEAEVTDQRASLPVTWVSEVWGRGFVATDGMLVLSVLEFDAAGREFKVLAVAPGKGRVAIGVTQWETT